MKINAPKKILIMKFRNIGDVLLTTPLIKNLKLNDIVMMNCGGADNVKPVFEEIVKNNLKRLRLNWRKIQITVN